MSERGLPANVGSNEGLGVGDGARWYCVSRDGLAMLCLNEHNAHAMAAQNATHYPNQAPYKAVALGDVVAERERMVADGWRKTRYVSPVTDCEACLTKDACQIRGQCAHYLRETPNVVLTGARDNGGET